MLLELARVGNQRDSSRVADHGALDLGFERVGVGQVALPLDALAGKDHAISKETLNRAERLSPDERLGELAVATAEADELDLRGVRPPDQSH